MAVRPNDSSVVFLESEVVNEAQDWLEEKKHEQDDANDGMCVVHGAQIAGHVLNHVDSHCESGDVEEVGKELEEAMD